MAKGEKKPRKKREHLKDFYRDVSGKYVYGGVMYTCTLLPADRKKNILRMWLGSGAAFIMQIIAGCVPSAGMSEGFLVLPFYLGAIISCGMVCWALWELTSGGEPVRAYVYDASVKKLPGRCNAGMIFCGLTLVGLILDVVLNGMGKGKIWATVLFVAIQIAAASGLFLVKKILQSIKWVKK